MTQEHISHPEGLPPCAAGHGARHIVDKRRASAGGGHFVECRCTSTTKHPDAASALASWLRMNRPARSARKVSVTPCDIGNVVQMPLRLATADLPHRRASGRG